MFFISHRQLPESDGARLSSIICFCLNHFNVTVTQILTVKALVFTFENLYRIMNLGKAD